MQTCQQHQKNAKNIKITTHIEKSESTQKVQSRVKLAPRLTYWLYFFYFTGNTTGAVTNVDQLFLISR